MQLKTLLSSIFVSTTLFCSYSLGQTLTQTVKGTVKETVTQQALAYASIIVENTNPPLGAVTDENGNFRIENVPVGRYSFTASYIGNKPATFREILVGSGKEVCLSFELEPDVNNLSEVTIKASSRDKDKPINTMAMISSLSFNVEESRRYAGGMDDPARLVTAFAGVATGGNAQDNAIVIRGNSPRGVQWRVEGMEVPNPNHFANVNVVGGGFMSILSSQTMNKSDFFTGAFPAEYGNALAGVFDIKLRNGNNERHEHTFQAGILGIDLSSEGPLYKGKEASYLFNYRYSTMGLLAKMGIIPDEGILYQDLSFKLNVPTKAGSFILWGLGAIDETGSDALYDSTQWITDDDRFKNQWKEQFGAIGVNHKVNLNKQFHLSTSVAVSGSSKTLTMDWLNEQHVLNKDVDLSSDNGKTTIGTTLTSRICARHSNKTGLKVNTLSYNFNLNGAQQHEPGTYRNFSDEIGNSNHIQLFTQSKYSFTNQLSITGGVHFEYFTLNGKYTIDPRGALSWNFNENQTLSFGYGKHSQLEDLNILLYRRQEDGNWINPNRNLDFMHAHHMVLGYDFAISPQLRVKIEPYYQYLYNIAGEENSSFSMLNFKRDFAFGRDLLNNTEGQNIGIDITFERFLENNFYYLVTTSIFDSRYKAGDNVWRNTRYNKTFVANVLAGKEFAIRKNNLLGINLRGTFSGGEFRTPMKQAESDAIRRPVFEEENAFSVRDKFSSYVDVSVTYRINKKKYSGIWALQVKNVLGNRQKDEYLYNYKTNRVEHDSRVIVVPSLSYKIEF